MQSAEMYGGEDEGNVFVIAFRARAKVDKCEMDLLSDDLDLTSAEDMANAVKAFRDSKKEYKVIIDNLVEQEIWMVNSWSAYYQAVHIKNMFGYGGTVVVGDTGPDVDMESLVAMLEEAGFSVITQKEKEAQAAKRNKRTDSSALQSAEMYGGEDEGNVFVIAFRARAKVVRCEMDLLSDDLDLTSAEDMANAVKAFRDSKKDYKVIIDNLVEQEIWMINSWSDYYQAVHIKNMFGYGGTVVVGDTGPDVDMESLVAMLEEAGFSVITQKKEAQAAKRNKRTKGKKKRKL